MRILVTITVLVAVFSPSADATAQEQNNALQDFHNFFGTFVGSEWTYHTHMTGPDGATLYKGKDVRTYEYGVRGRFIIENVFNEDDDGAKTHIGIQLLGVNTKTGALNLSAFWPWQSTALGDVSAELVPSADGEFEFKGIARPAGMQHPTMNFHCAFQDPDVYQCTSRTTNEDGAEFQSNVETFTRRK